MIRVARNAEHSFLWSVLGGLSLMREAPQYEEREVLGSYNVAMLRKRAPKPLDLLAREQFRTASPRPWLQPSTSAPEGRSRA
jgi:hypothetical protein